jgi:16S rRNA (adenine1518-N6/adenine1519-N6)-dimethyltransferase
VRATPPAANALLEELVRAGFKPKKALGQNFLRDGNLARALAAMARVGPGDFVLEVGAGTGALTGELLALGARVLAVEVDPRLMQALSRRFAGVEQLEVLGADALHGKHALAPAVLERLPSRGSWHVVANLPYAAGTPILVLLTQLKHAPESLSVLVQSELAERAAAPPGSADYSALSARLQLDYRCQVVRKVGREVFWPRPRVHSAVLRLERRSERVPAALRERALALIERSFSQRRKALLGLLADGPGERQRVGRLLERRGIDPRSRAETLGREQILDLAAALEDPAPASRRPADPIG